MTGHTKICNDQSATIERLSAALAEARADIKLAEEFARALAFEEAARVLHRKVILFSEIDVLMTRHEESEHYAQEILALAPLPPTLRAVPVDDVFWG